MEDKTKQYIQQFHSGDKKVFDDIVILHKEWTINMILSMVHNKQDAEDISQDVFVTVYFSLSKFKGLSSFKTWLYRIVINKVNAHYRKLKIRSAFNLELSDVDSMNFNYTQEDSFFRKYDKELLFKTIIYLKSKERNIVLLRIYQGHTFSEISRLLNLTINNVKVTFSQAKKKIKNKMI